MREMSRGRNAAVTKDWQTNEDKRMQTPHLFVLIRLPSLTALSAPPAKSRNRNYSAICP